MYFPKSQIKTNLHTNGNLLRYEDTKVEYKGNTLKLLQDYIIVAKIPRIHP